MARPEDDKVGGKLALHVSASDQETRRISTHSHGHRMTTLYCASPDWKGSCLQCPVSLRCVPEAGSPALARFLSRTLLFCFHEITRGEALASGMRLAVACVRAQCNRNRPRSGFGWQPLAKATMKLLPHW